MKLLLLEEPLQRLIQYAAKGNRLLFVCLSLAIAGTVSATYPITAVVVPAVLIQPKLRWRIVAATALGSTIGAMLLMAIFHHMGWAQVYDRFPELTTHPTWGRIMTWTSGYGALGLFLIAALPLPQTPALIFFAIVRHDYLSVFVAILGGKALKYGLFAWGAERFPARFNTRMGKFPCFPKARNGPHKES